MEPVPAEVIDRARERRTRNLSATTEITSVDSMMGVIAAAALNSGHGYRRFDWSTTHDEQHVARTSDGWNPALYCSRTRFTIGPTEVIRSPSRPHLGIGQSTEVTFREGV